MTRLGSRAVVAVGVLLLSAGSASAMSYQCSTGNVQCLIEAIRAANANGLSENTIGLDSGTYTVLAADNVADGMNGLPSVTSRLVIDVNGTGVVTLERPATGARFRFFHVGATGNLTLRHLFVVRGDAPFIGGLSDCAGGLFNRGVVTISDSAFTSHSTEGICNSGGSVTIADSMISSNRGGGVFNTGSLTMTRTTVQQNINLGPAGILSTAGVITIDRCVFDRNSGQLDAGGIGLYGGSASIMHTTFVGNNSQGAGGIWITPPATLSLTRSAMVGNTAAAGGAAIINGGTAEIGDTTIANNVSDGIFGTAQVSIINNGTLTLTNDTFANNRPTPRATSSAVLGTSSGAITTVRNTVFGHVAGEFVQECQGVLISQGNNIFGNLVGCAVTLQASDVVGDAGLGTYADNGTPGSQHYEVLPTSVAIDRANKLACGRFDQLDQPRLNRCDIGAIEFQKPGYPPQEDRPVEPSTLTR